MVRVSEVALGYEKQKWGRGAAEKKLTGLQKKKTLVKAHRHGASRRTVPHNDWLC